MKTKNKPSDLITMCDQCLQASCWQGMFMCDNAQQAGTVRKRRSTLLKLKLEHPSYLLTEKQMEELFGDEVVNESCKKH
jgi:hypothetical protein